MINISAANKAKWNISTEDKTLTISFPDDNITITNADIVAESLTLEEALNEDVVLSFTGCIASRFSFEIADIVQDLRGHKVTAQIAIGTQAAVPLFYGYVDTQDNQSHQDVVTRFECYDPLVSKINERHVTAWYKNLSFPRTVKSFRDAFFSHLGISQRAISLPNDDLQMTGQTIDDEEITGGQIIKYICQLNGVFGQFDRYGYFKYKQITPITKGLYPAVDLYPSPDLFPSRENANIDASSIYSAIQYEPFEVDYITGVKIIGSSGTTEGSFGDLTNPLTISDNPLAWAVDMNLAAQNLLVQVSGLWFVPSQIRAVGLPYIECGDAVFINTKKNIVRSYILSRTLSGIQAIEDEYRCNSQKKQPIYRESAETQITRNADGVEENAHEIQQNYIYTDNLVASEAVRTNTLVANSIQAEAIRTNNLVASEINAEVTRTNTLVANSIQAEATRTNTLVANSISAEAVRTNNLVAREISAEATRTNNLIASEISAEVTRSNNLIAQKADLTYVNGNFATFGYLNTNYLTANDINTTFLKTRDLRSQTIYADQIYSLTISASQITSGTISAARIDADTLATNSFASKTINCSGIYATTGLSGNTLIARGAFSFGSRTASWTPMTINGTQYVVMTGS